MPITNPIKKIQAQKEIIQQLPKVPNIYMFFYCSLSMEENGVKTSQIIDDAKELATFS
jgi:hypothetical protein